MIRSMYSGVAGLKSHQTKMDVIGNNISNVSTYAFKGSRVIFRDVFYQTTKNATNATNNVGGNNASQIGYGASVSTIDINTNRSGMVSTGLNMDCYINGEGYFVVSDERGNIRYTRIGAFSFDGDGNLVDGNNLLVQGFQTAGTKYEAVVNGAKIDFGQSASAKMLSGYKINVQHGPAGTPGTVLLNEADKTMVVTIDGTVADTVAEFENTLTTAGKYSWAGGTPPAGFTVTDVTADVTVTTDNTAMAPGSGKIGDVILFDVNPDGSNDIDKIGKIVNTHGMLISQSIDTSGIITGVTKTGEVVTIGKICLANVENPAALVMEGTSYFVEKNNAGEITYNEPNDGLVGGLVTGCLEAPNVDLATELSDMILTERGYQANSKMITVSDEMLQELINMKR